MTFPMRCAAIAVALSIAAASSVAARTLRWRSLDVVARLESSGELLVRERHVMVFNGDWNGGERVFRVEPGQQLVFRSIARVDAGGVERKLTENNPPARIDEYTWVDAKHLRWRVRRASDPPLRNRELTYVLEYSLRNILARAGDRYRLNHDFAGADRDGPIERYSLRLELAPEWSASPPDTPLMFERVHLPPAETVIGRFVLEYRGAGAPQFIASPQPPPQRRAAAATAPSPAPVRNWPVNLAALAVFGTVALFALRAFIAREDSLGRYATVETSRSWLNGYILKHRPEVLGAAWDNTTGEAEAAALIALMALEGKIQQSRRGSKPQLKLLVPRESLSEYERTFVDRLFVAGDEIDPDTLKKHYSATGFSPSAGIAAPLAREAKQLVGSPPVLLSCIAGGVLGIFAFNFFPVIGAFAYDGISILAGFAGAAALPVTLIIAVKYRSGLRGRHVVRWIAAPSLLFATLAFLSASAGVSVFFCFAASGILLLGLLVGRWNGTPEQLVNLRNIRAARDLLRRMLEQKNDLIEDHWIPYILAFGLGRDLDRWSVTPEARVQSTRTLSTVSSSAGPVLTPATQFMSGGGAFGGGGATGGWASGIASFAAGVSAPSSSSSSGFSSGSSSGGGGSGGGSRSGGGRSGGW